MWVISGDVKEEGRGGDVVLLGYPLHLPVKVYIVPELINELPRRLKSFSCIKAGWYLAMPPLLLALPMGVKV